MGHKAKFSVGLWCLGGCTDRFVAGGYLAKPPSLFEVIDIAAEVESISGIEAISSQLDGIDCSEFSSRLKDVDLAVTGVLADTFSDRTFKLGSLSHTDPAIRSKAIDTCKRTVELAERLACGTTTLWLGTDGYDYPFQTNYARHWEMLQEGIAKVAAFNPQMRIALEYKLKEPRQFVTVATAAKALLIAKRTGDNVGVTLDFGHSLMAKENPAESVALLAAEKRLFNVHVNDAYGEWDDDMIVASVNIPQTLEFLYWLEQVDYGGWIALDIFPFREDAAAAAAQSIHNLVSLFRVLDVLRKDGLEKGQASLDAMSTQKVVAEALLRVS